MIFPSGVKQFYCIMLCCIMLCCVVLCCVVLCGVVLCCVVLCCVVLRCVVLCWVVLCCIMLCCVVFYCIVLYCKHTMIIVPTIVIIAVDLIIGRFFIQFLLSKLYYSAQTMMLYHIFEYSDTDSGFVIFSTLFTSQE